MRKDTGYSTASSQTSARNNIINSQSRRSNLSKSQEIVDPESRKLVKERNNGYNQNYRERRQFDDAFSEESDNGDERSRVNIKMKKTRGKSNNEPVRTASDSPSD